MRRDFAHQLRLLAICLLSALLSAAEPPPAHAQDAVRAGAHNRAATSDQTARDHDATPDDIWAWREHWTGIEQFGSTLSVFSGATVAVGGSVLTENGWRLRSSGHGDSQIDRAWRGSW